MFSPRTPSCRIALGRLGQPLRDTGIGGSAEGEQGGERHAGETRRHREAAVVGRGRHQEHVRGGPAGMLPGQLPLLVAGDHEVVHLGQALLGELGGRDALRAVPGPGEGDQQGREILGEAASRVGDDVRGGHGVDPPPEPPRQCRGQHLPGETRGAGAGEHHAQVVAGHQRPEEAVERGPGGGDDAVDLTPDAGLLGDLTDGVVGPDAASQGAEKAGHRNSFVVLSRAIVWCSHPRSHLADVVGS